jgi:hypothetical protein
MSHDTPRMNNEELRDLEAAREPAAAPVSDPAPPEDSPVLTQELILADEPAPALSKDRRWASPQR